MRVGEGFIRLMWPLGYSLSTSPHTSSSAEFEAVGGVSAHTVEWQAIPVDTVNGLIDSMHDHLQEVIATQTVKYDTERSLTFLDPKVNDPHIFPNLGHPFCRNPLLRTTFSKLCFVQKHILKSAS